jgi:type IV pilus assembly protein PilC
VLKSLALWARQTALLLRAGLTSAEALDTLRNQPDDPVLGTVVSGLYRRVMCGMQFSQALAEFPQVFPPHIRGVLRAGEGSGDLAGCFESVADLYEHELGLRGRLRHAALYPLIVGSVTLGLCLALTLFVVPHFGAFYSDFSGGEAQLPALTRRLLQAVEWLAGHWLCLPWLPLLVPALRWLRNAPPIKVRLDPLVVRLPLLGLLTRKAETARCARSLGALLGAGMPASEALALAAGCTDNLAVRRGMQAAMRRTSSGMSLTQALRGERAFAPLLPSVVSAVTDATGAASNLRLVAESYEADVNRTLDVLLRQLEPVMMILIGLYTGLVAVALYLPMFNLVGVIQ